MKNYINYMAVLSAGAFALLGSPAAKATPTIEVFDNAAHSTGPIADQGVGDLAPTIPNVVVASGTLGKWTFNLNTGGSSPASPNGPGLQLGFMNYITSGDTTHGANLTGNTLTIEFSENGFLNGGAASFLDTIAPDLGAGLSITYSTYVNASNALFDTTGPAVTTVSFGPQDSTTAYSSNLFGSVASLGTPYSATLVIQLTYSGTGTVIGLGNEASGNGTMALTAPDGGTTAALLGFSLLSLALVRRKLIMA